MITAADDVAAAARRGPLVVRALLVLLALAAVATVVAQLWAGGGRDSFGRISSSTAPYLAFGVAPLLATAAATMIISRRAPRGLPVVVVGALVVLAFTFLSTADWLIAMVTGDAMEGDGQSGLIFLFAPIYQWLALIVTTGAAVLVHAVLSRRARART